MARSALASTYTWTLPTPVSMTGTVDSRTTVRMRSAPPRGTSTSTSPRACMSATAPGRPCRSIDCTRSPGSPCASSARASTSTITSLELAAADPPRRITAFPLLSARPAASTVTLGRAS